MSRDAPIVVSPPTAETGLARIRRRMVSAAVAAGRDPGTLTLLAVSKGQPIDALRDLLRQGQRAFGENYVQEALPKIAALRGEDLSWHFIGRLQSNKTREVATHFSWVHSLDRLRLAERLSAQRPDHLAPLDCCIEVNLNQEASKSGIDLPAVAALVAAIDRLPRLRLRGLMGMPAPQADPARARASFAALRDCLATCGGALDTLSMGTSADFEAAITEGATLVRIGTALFGPRLPRGTVPEG